MLTLNVSYLLIVVLLGTYGFFYAGYAPNPTTAIWAKNLSLVFFIYFLIISLVFFLRHREKITTKLRSKTKFYLFLTLSLPSIFALLSFIHFAALSKGFPSIYSELFIPKKSIEAVITGKNVWGKKDRRREISLSGFTGSFPVSKRYYNSVSVGQSVTLLTMESGFGTKLEFTKP